MVLNDVGAQYDYMITDVSRAGRATESSPSGSGFCISACWRPRNHMFSIIRPGMKMADVDATIRRYNAERLLEAGVLKDVGTKLAS